MDVNTILKLIDAGYTKADIEAMNAPASTEASAPVEAPAEEKPAEEKPAEAPAMTGDDILQNLLAEVKGLKAQIQSNNIKNDSMNMNHAPDLTAEQILASIINPKKEG
jgi:hypothetical protein